MPVAPGLSYWSYNRSALGAALRGVVPAVPTAILSRGLRAGLGSGLPSWVCRFVVLMAFDAEGIVAAPWSWAVDGDEAAGSYGGALAGMPANAAPAESRVPSKTTSTGKTLGRL